MNRIFVSSLVGALALSVGASAALSQDRVDRSVAVNSWFASLAPGIAEQAAAQTAGAMLADEATIALMDLGITMNRDEYIDSLAQWSDLIEGGSIAHRIEGASAELASAVVCYRFSGNDQLNRESFRFDGDKIIAVVAVKLADDCAAF